MVNLLNRNGSCSYNSSCFLDDRLALHRFVFYGLNDRKALLIFFGSPKHNKQAILGYLRGYWVSGYGCIDYDIRLCLN